MTCAENALVTRLAAGWMFANLFNYYFKETEVVLELKDATQLSFVATETWLTNNALERQNIDREALSRVFAHTSTCGAEECIAAYERVQLVKPFLETGALPGGSGVALASVFVSGFLGDQCEFSYEQGCGETIDALTPFFLWFQEPIWK